ncbi:MAG: phosphate/phosphite/phosphonate ABC transporter substrate-binding protein [Bacteroidota bacterium]
MIKRQTVITSVVLLTVISVVFTFFFYRYIMNIDGIIEPAFDTVVVDSATAKKPVITISVISRYPPNIIYSGYQPMLDYMTSKSAYRFELKLCDDYNQAVQMLLTKEAAAAFLGSYVYIKARAEHGVVPILKPLNSDFEPFSRSVLFTNSTKNIFSIADLKHMRLALPSQESNSSNWMLHYEFKKHNIHMSDLSAVVNFPHHHSVIHNVMNNLFDAGVTREYLIKKMRNRNIRTLLYSDPFPTSPIVVAKDCPPQIVEAMKKILLTIGRDTPDREQITRGWDNEFVYGFVEADDKDYDVIRAINKGKE